ncbi:MAG: (2Fe-2S)-binding protein [Anaerolineales bacterium]|nr:(2Fe-2S)-binding protein [Chloroflexota bacterium]MBL6982510.1 (2Fe-2S)-binding protein [Anaerolineales bacterium]
MQLTINRQTYSITEDQEIRMLVWVLRDQLGLTGTKYGCGAGICGSCTVLVDGKPTRSCLTPAATVADKEITTIEGLGIIQDGGEEILHPVQQAFLETQTPQCGYCMSGQMITAAALLDDNPAPAEEDIIAGMNDVYCRCGTYVRIKEAVARAAEIIAEESSNG